MTDITFKIIGISNPTIKPVEPYIQTSADLYFSIHSELRKLEQIYSNLQSSLPTDHIHDREALTFLAHCNVEIEKLKQIKTNRLLPGIIKSLYSNIKSFTSIVEKIQKLKSNATKTLKQMEKSRSEIKVPIQKSIIDNSESNPEFTQSNKSLLLELKKTDELIESTQEAAFQLSAILKHFTQIVSEQEYMSTNILADAENSLTNMKSANVHLASANERSKGYEKIWAFYFMVLSFILIFYDWKTSRVVYIVD